MSLDDEFAEAFSEAFYQLQKFEPEPLALSDVRPSHRGNPRVLRDLWDDEDLKALRKHLDRET